MFKWDDPPFNQKYMNVGKIAEHGRWKWLYHTFYERIFEKRIKSSTVYKLIRADMPIICTVRLGKTADMLQVPTKKRTICAS